MREIKFRAWDKIAKKYMIPWPDGFSILGETTCFDLIGMQLKERNPEKTTLEMLNDVEIEQFTGLLDKQGKGIYEGDVVEQGNGVISQIIWSTILNGWAAEFISGLYPGAEGQLWDTVIRAMGGFEVIGNIHDNPELLEEPDK